MSKPLSVLHVIESPSWTGAMAQTLELVLGLRSRGHRVTLATTRGSILWDRALTAGVDVQGNRLEYEVVGHGENGETWGVMQADSF